MGCVRGGQADAAHEDVKAERECMLGLRNVARKVFGTPNDRKVKATRPLVDKINALEPEFEKLSDEGLSEKTAASIQEIAGIVSEAGLAIQTGRTAVVGAADISTRLAAEIESIAGLTAAVRESVAARQESSVQIATSIARLSREAAQTDQAAQEQDDVAREIEQLILTITVQSEEVSGQARLLSETAEGVYRMAGQIDRILTRFRTARRPLDAAGDARLPV